ncbi:hypothetical protein WMF39_17210 [Sorangium sp. So ce1504]|uniref:hypothetical protein n=1 Tax=Sorangium sp. So ce1504 TaxID=3133337 RepID=UPI003F5DDAC9
MRVRLILDIGGPISGCFAYVIMAACSTSEPAAASDVPNGEGAEAQVSAAHSSGGGFMGAGGHGGSSPETGVAGSGGMGGDISPGITCAAGLEPTVGTEFSITLDCPNPESDRMCWYTHAEREFPFCIGSWQYGDCVAINQSGARCPSDGMVAKCVIAENPIQGTTVDGTMEVWFYAATDGVVRWCELNHGTVVYP